MKGTYADTLQVWNTLSKQDQSYLGGKHIDSPALVFRNVEYDDGKPVGFIEVYDESKVDPKYGSADRAIISIAVSPEYRRKGIGRKLLSDARQWFNHQNKFTKLEYSILNGNTASEHLIHNTSFKTSRAETDKYHAYEVQKNMQESMGLASMNPMVGTNSNSGSYIVNVMNHDKDLGDTKNYTGLAKSLDIDSNLYGIDQNGRVQAKKKYEVMNQEDIVEVFKITSSDAEIIAESIIREALLPYDQRPIHGQNYIYEVFTKKPFMMHEQFYFEPILEKVELEKMSAGLAGVVTGNDRTMNMQHKGKKQSNYIPDNDYPSGTENLHYQESFSVKSSLKDNFQSKSGINLNSFKKIPMSDSSIATYKSKCKGLSHVRTGSDYIGTIFVDKQNDVVAYINIRKSDSYIQGLEVSEKYRGQHLSPQLVQYAEKDLHASKLTVNKSNEVAYSLYKKLGWKDDHIDGQMIHMIKESNTLLKEIARTKYILEEAKEIETGKHLVPYRCEIKNSYHTLQGIIKKPLPMLILHSDKKQWRIRAELLLMKDDQIWLMKEDKPNHYGLTYKLPGGGIDNPDEYIEDACARECTEEILIVPKNVIYTGVDIKQIYPHIPEWHKVTLWKDDIKYDGSITFVCIGEYDKPYKGYIKKVDRMSDMVQKGKFYKYSEVKRILHPKHREIIEQYLKQRGYMK